MSAIPKLLTPLYRIDPADRSSGERLERFSSRAPPVQEVEVEPVGAEPVEARPARSDRPRAQVPGLQTAERGGREDGGDQEPVEQEIGDEQDRAHHRDGDAREAGER
jgi:hypothetical protein